jgi:hypothetical protein
MSFWGKYIKRVQRLKKGANIRENGRKRTNTGKL